VLLLLLVLLQWVLLLLLVVPTTTAVGAICAPATTTARTPEAEGSRLGLGWVVAVGAVVVRCGARDIATASTNETAQPKTTTTVGAVVAGAHPGGRGQPVRREELHGAPGARPCGSALNTPYCTPY
jgi:hypothetical protein